MAEAEKRKTRFPRVALLLLLLGGLAVMVFVVAYFRSLQMVSGAAVATFHLGLLLMFTSFLIRQYQRKRVLLANIVLTLLLCYCVEVFYFVLLGMPAMAKTDCPLSSAPEGVEQQCMGSLPPADTAIRRIEVIEGDTVCNITMTTDRYRKRITPDHNSENQRFAMFFGCSIVFGEGVEDDETMPWHFQQLSGEYNAYNYGANGHATNHVLARFTCENLREQVPEQEGVAFYLFFWDHLWRANGSMNRYLAWMSNAPYFEMKQGHLVRDRSFRDGRRGLSTLYWLLSHSSIVKYYGLDFPVKLRRKHVELIAEMVDEVRNQFKTQFGTDAFYFVYYPEWGEPDPVLRNHLNACLKARGVKIIDLSKGGYHQEMTLGWDPHPSSATHQRLAADLLQHLCAMH
jgi:hypothetical protein